MTTRTHDTEASTESSFPCTSSAIPHGRSKTSRYTATPTLPKEQVHIYETYLAVLSGHKTVTGAAQELDMARNQLQTGLHIAQRAFIEALPTGRRTGRPRMSESERHARQTVRDQASRLERLEAELQTLRSRLDTTSELLRENVALPATTPTRRGRPYSKTRSPRSRDSRATITTTTGSMTHRTSSNEIRRREAVSTNRAATRTRRSRWGRSAIAT